MLRSFLNFAFITILIVKYKLLNRVYTKDWCGFKSERKIYLSPYTGTTYTVSSSNCPSFSCATSSSLLMPIAGPVSKMASHCNHRSGHLKTVHIESVFLLRRHLGNWPRGPAVSTRSELLVAHEKLGQLPLLMVYVLPV